MVEQIVDYYNCATICATIRATTGNMLQYKIPQNIDIADKIVGPLTLRQLITVAIGAGISYVLFAVSSKLYELNTLEYVVIALPAIIAAAAAFIKINNIPFTKFVLLSLEYAIKPKKRFWDHRGIVSITAPELETITVDISDKTDGRGKKAVNLDELSRILDSGGFEKVEEVRHEDIDKASDDNLMAQAFFGHKKAESDTENMYWRTVDSHKKMLSIIAKAPSVKKAEPVKTAVVVQKSAQTDGQVKTITPPAPAVQKIPIKNMENKGAEVKPMIPVQPKQEIKTVQKPVEPVPKIQPKTEPLVKPTQMTQPRPQETVKPPVQNQPMPARPLEKTVPMARPAIQDPAQMNVPAQPGKKKRRRKKKPRSGQQPVRPETQISTVQKNQPLKLMPKPQTTPQSQPSVNGKKEPKKEGGEKGTSPATTSLTRDVASNSAKGGEIHLEELQRGEIEFNLD